jgi:hypothetical protein
LCSDLSKSISFLEKCWMKVFVGCVAIMFFSLVLSLTAQTGVSNSPAATGPVPPLVRFGAAVKDRYGNPVTGKLNLTFSLYSEQTGGTPLWQETQNLVLDGNGHYSAMLGSTLPNGVPLEFFSSGQAQWLGVQPEGQAEQPRVMFLSVPYALKAEDAATLGGLPPSAFVQAVPSRVDTAASPGSLSTIVGVGTQDYVPGWSNPNSDLGEAMADQSVAGTTKAAAGRSTPQANCQFAGMLVVSPSCFSGSDIFAQINTAMASLPSTGGTILVPPNKNGTCYVGSTTITVTKLVSIQGLGASPTCLNYTGSGVAVAVSWGSNHYPDKLLYRIQLIGPGAGTATTGVVIGSSRNSDQVTIEETRISNFGTNIMFANNSYNALLTKVNLSMAGYCVLFSTINEETRIESSTFTGCYESLTFSNGTIDVSLIGNSFDDQTGSAWAIHAIGGGPCFNCNVEIFGFGNHFENQSGSTGQYITANVTGDGPRIFEYAGDINDYTRSGTIPQVIQCIGCDTLVMDGVQIFSAGRVATSIVNVIGSASVELKFVNLSPAYLATNCTGCSSGRAAMMDIRTLGGPQVPWNLINVTLALTKGRLKLSDQGSCTMVSGACSQQEFATPYNSAPVCFANWTGTGALTGIIRVPATATSVTPQSTVNTDSAQVGWACLGT